MSKLNKLDLVQDIMDKTDQEIEKMQPANILVAGKTGVGKSTLINGLFREKLATTGIGQPVTQHIQKIEKEGVPLTLYDTRGLELSPQVQDQVKAEIKKIFQETEGTPGQLHVTYYCINASSNRIEDAEIDIIQSIAQQMPVILVLTQSLGQAVLPFKEHLEDMDLPVAAIMPVMAQDYVISEDVVIEQYGLKELIEKTFELIPDEVEQAFNNAQHADIARKAAAARRWARKYIAASFGVGFTPIPFSDASVLVPMQVGLIAHITAIFGISLDRSSLLSIVAAVFGTTGATQAGRYVVTNLMKLIPGAGTLAGGAISGGTAAAITSALAVSYIEVLSLVAKAEKEGRLDELPEIGAMMKDHYAKQLNKNKDVEQLEDIDGIDSETDHVPDQPISKSAETGEDSEGKKGLFDRIKGRFKK